MNRNEDPPFFFSSKVEEWFMITVLVANCLLDLFGFRFGTNLNG